MSQQSNPEAKARAEAKFTKQQERQREGQVAMAAYHAENRAVDEKTARLRAARLAREAQEQAQQKADDQARQQADAQKAAEKAAQKAAASPRDAAAAFLAKRRVLKTPAAKAVPKPRARKKSAAH